MQEYIFGVKSIRALIHPEKYPEKERRKLLKWVDDLESFYERHANIFASNASPNLDSVSIKTGITERRKLNEEELEGWNHSIIKEFRYIVMHCPFILGMYKNFRAKERGYRAKRRVKLQDKLSESA